MLSFAWPSFQILALVQTVYSIPSFICLYLKIAVSLNTFWTITMFEAIGRFNLFSSHSRRIRNTCGTSYLNVTSTKNECCYLSQSTCWLLQLSSMSYVDTCWCGQTYIPSSVAASIQKVTLQSARAPRQPGIFLMSFREKKLHTKN